MIRSILRPTRSLVAFVAVAAMLGAAAAASGAQPGLYVTQTNGGGATVLFGFNAHNVLNGPPACTLSGLNFVGDIGSDAAGNVYVPQTAAGTVTIFAPRCGRVLGTITDPFESPQSVSVRGTTVYLAGGTTVAVCTVSAGCARGLTDPSIFQITGAAVDSHGDVFVAYYDLSVGVSLLAFPNGTMPGVRFTGYQDGPVPGGILFDAHDALISVLTGFPTVNIYACRIAQRRCRATRSLGARGQVNFGALDARNRTFALTDSGNTSVDVYAYPSLKFAFGFNNGLQPGAAAKGIAQTK